MSNTTDSTRSSWSRRRWLRSGAAASVAAATAPAIRSSGAAEPASQHGGNPGNDSDGLAFVVVSDTHYTAPQDAPDELVTDIVEVNQRLIDDINSLPEQEFPDELGGGRISPPRGVLHLGDMIDTGDKGIGELSVRRQHTEWQAYLRDFGLSGAEGRLKHPVYEVHGNHDSVREMNEVMESLIERNRRRPAVNHVSDSGVCYSWDWQGVHFVALGIVVGHNDQGLPIGRYKAYDSLEFLRLDLRERVGDSGRPVILMHHIDLLRYSEECSPDSPAGGEWSACDVAAYRRAVEGFNVAAIFHGHLHGLRTDHWDGTTESTAAGEGIPVFGARAAGAGGSNRGYFHCRVEKGNLVVRERVSLRAPDGWREDNTNWGGRWQVPLRAPAAAG